MLQLCRNTLLVFSIFMLLIANSYCQEIPMSVELFMADQNFDLSDVGGMSTIDIEQGDLNNDGLLDLVIQERSNQSYSVLLADNAGEFRYSHHFSQQINRLNLNGWISLIDLNQDNQLDLLTYFSPTQLQLFSGNYEDGVLTFGFDTLIEIDNLPAPDMELFDQNDRPVFYDFDKDGDLDVLTFAYPGTDISLVENHSNISFSYKQNCWNNIVNDYLTGELRVDDTCSDNVQTSLPSKNIHLIPDFEIFDYNDDGLDDIVLSETLSGALIFYQNQSSSNTFDLLLDSTFNINTEYTIPLIRTLERQSGPDQLVVTNGDLRFGSDDQDVVQFYSKDETNRFVKDQSNLLESRIFDVGVAANPIFNDFNDDGFVDLAVVNFGYDSDDDLVANSKISLFQNIGEFEKPVFQLISDDYLGISSLNIPRFTPAFGDLNGDDADDIVAGNDYGELIHFITTPTGIVRTDLLDGFDIGAASYPALFDFNQDGLLDILVGENRGNLNLFLNMGTSIEPDFELVDESWGDIQVSLPNGAVGNIFPKIIESAEGATLYISSFKGEIEKYQLDQTAGVTIPTLTELPLVEYNLGTKQVIIDAADINDDGFIDYVVGFDKGGVVFFTENVDLPSSSNNVVISDDELVSIKYYPNPVTTTLHVELETQTQSIITIYNQLGQLIERKKSNPYQTQFDLSNQAAGNYWLTIHNDKSKLTQAFNINKN